MATDLARDHAPAVACGAGYALRFWTIVHACGDALGWVTHDFLPLEAVIAFLAALIAAVSALRVGLSMPLLSGW